MRIGILQCDTLDAAVASVAGDYDELYAAMVRSVAPDVDTVVYRVDRDGPPPSIAGCDAWLIGGSRCSVVDDDQWIVDLRRFLRRLLASDTPVVGICFGHQLLGQVLGAPVGAAACGWSIGATEYTLVADPPGDHEGPPSYRLPASHRDQVLDLPDGARLLATSDRTPVAAFTVDDRILAVQAHPEFPARVAARLYECRADQIGAGLVADAVESLAGPLHHDRVAGWAVALASHADG